jgi:sec-independent protein translocase protein TatB
MFGMGMQEIIVVLAIALIVIGPKKLPDLAKSLGRAMGEFKKATRDFKDSIQVDELDDVKRDFNNLNDDIKDTFDVSIDTTITDDSSPTNGSETEPDTKKPDVKDSKKAAPDKSKDE